jgi:hypothetical protein
MFPVTHLVAPKDVSPDAAFVDNRTCAQCTCSITQYGTCNRTLALFGVGACGGAAATATATSGPCSNADCGGNGCGSGKMQATAVPGSCAATGGNPSGIVDLAVAGRQYCCDQ